MGIGWNGAAGIISLLLLQEVPHVSVPVHQEPGARCQVCFCRVLAFVRYDEYIHITEKVGATQL